MCLMVIFQEAGGEIIFFCVTELGWLFTPASSLEAILVQPAVVCCCVFCGTDFPIRQRGSRDKWGQACCRNVFLLPDLVIRVSDQKRLFISL